VFENRVLRRIFQLKRDEVRKCSRKLHNEELHNMYSAPVIIRIINLRKTRPAQNMKRMGIFVGTSHKEATGEI
jgi:hypothetical protein